MNKDLLWTGLLSTVLLIGIGFATLNYFTNSIGAGTISVPWRPRGGMVIVAAGGSGGVDSVEAWFPGEIGSLCRLPPLPSTYWDHSMDWVPGRGLVLCGGRSAEGIEKICYNLAPGAPTWTHLVDAVLERSGHTSVVNEDGDLLLLGGTALYRHTKGTDIIVLGGDVVPEAHQGLDLADKAAGHCTIKTGPNKMVVIGGTYSMNKVVEYDLNSGETRELPNLLTGRNGHACAAFNDPSGNQVLVVVGGSGSEPGLTHGTEIYRGGDSWEKEGFQEPIRHAQAVTVDNKVYLVGGRGYYDNQPKKNILEYLPEQQGKWTQAGQMTEDRTSHAVAVVPTSFRASFARIQNC